MTVLNLLQNDPNSGYFRINTDAKTGTKELVYEPWSILLRITLCLKRMVSWLMPGLLAPYQKSEVARLIKFQIKHFVSLSNINSLTTDNVKETLSHLEALKKRFTKSYSNERDLITRRLDRAINRLKDHALVKEDVTLTLLNSRYDTSNKGYAAYVEEIEKLSKSSISSKDPHLKKWIASVCDLVHAFLEPSRIIDTIRSLKGNDGNPIFIFSDNAKNLEVLSQKLKQSDLESYCQQQINYFLNSLRQENLHCSRIMYQNETVINALIDIGFDQCSRVNGQYDDLKKFLKFFFTQKFKLDLHYQYKKALVRQNLLGQQVSIKTKQQYSEIKALFTSDSTMTFEKALNGLIEQQQKVFLDKMQTLLQGCTSKDGLNLSYVVKCIDNYTREDFYKILAPRFDEFFRELKSLTTK